MDFFQALAGYVPSANVQYSSPGDLIKMANNRMPQYAALDVNFNKALAPGYGEAMRSFENSYAPGSTGLMDKITGGYSDLVNSGYNLPPQVQQSVLQQAMQTAPSGLGTGGPSQASIYHGAGTLGLSELAYRNANLANSASWLNSLPRYNPETTITPGSVIGMEQQRQQLQNAYNVAEAQRVALNAASAARMPVTIGSQVIGTIIGAAFGTQGIGSGLGVTGGASGLAGGAGNAGGMGAMGGGGFAGPAMASMTGGSTGGVGGVGGMTNAIGTAYPGAFTPTAPVYNPSTY